ncbi:MAG TPA: DUF11 domain-containing protein [Steroidobacteraceae bacterium]
MNVDARAVCCRHRRVGLIAALLAIPAVAFAQVDVALQKTLDVAVPAAGQVVQFTVRARNLGNRDALNVVVNDALPPGLAIPPGTAVYVSAGDYSPATGAWSMSQLAAGTAATLVMPAVVSMTSPPACLVNVAQNVTPDDANAGNDRATAAVKQDAATHCSDLAVEFEAIAMTPPVCSVSRSFDFFVKVSNLGPDDATDVLVDLAQVPQLAPGLRFVDSHCSGTRCRFDSIPAGATQRLEVQSYAFTNTQSQKVRFTLAASTSDVDYATADNQQFVDYVVTPFVSCDGLDDSAYVISGGCFIATAAYGSPLEPHVAALREFRDRHLRHTAAGRAFIRWYYEHSPRVAHYIGGHAWARAVTRTLLAPVVAAIVAPWRTLGALVLLGLAARTWRRRVRTA